MHKVTLLLAVVASACWTTVVFAEESNPEAVFAQRLKPIFQSPHPSSCVQCHLSSVDLKNYILPSSRDTFLSLRDQGLIDTKRPKDSKILHLISMGDRDADGRSRRIHAKTRQAEYEAFSHWIEACCRDTKLLAEPGPRTSAKAGPQQPDEVIRHTRKDRVLDSFVRNIWSQRMRCFPCHTPSELDHDNPLHAKPITRYREFVKKYGARMNVFKKTPLETMTALIASSRKQHGARLPLINLQQPSESLLLLKPTAKLPPKDEDGKLGQPSSQIPVSHMGGIKMHEGDQSYKAFLLWLQDYAKSVSGDYQSPDSLPADNWYPTQHVLRIKQLPASWPKLAKVQVFVHRWDEQTDNWHDTPVAFTQSLVTPRRFINGALFVLAKPDERKHLSPTGVKLTPGKVQLRIYLDRQARLEDSPLQMLNQREPDGTAVFEAKFGNGFKNADIVNGLEVSK